MVCKVCKRVRAQEFIGDDGICDFCHIDRCENEKPAGGLILWIIGVVALEIAVSGYFLWTYFF